MARHHHWPGNITVSFIMLLGKYRPFYYCVIFNKDNNLFVQNTSKLYLHWEHACSKGVERHIYATFDHVLLISG